MSTPLFLAMQEIQNKSRAPFHMPGHKGNPPYDMGDVFLRDITEVEGADSLYHCDDALYRLEQEYATLYGAHRSLLSAGGSTLCIQTMLSLATRRGDKVICSRMIHSAAVSAMALLGLSPHWIWPELADATDGIPGLALPVTPSQLKVALTHCPDAKAVYITSPDYIGQMADIKALAKLCHDAGLPLLVDNAHGAHLAFIKGYSHPIAQGADMCCDSLHKTLPVLTGGALLHIAHEDYAPPAKAAMAMFGSTSPSYPIMLSADMTLPYLKGAYIAAAVRLCERMARIKSVAQKCGFLLAQTEPHRISMGYRHMGYTDNDFSRHLREGGIEPEYLGGGLCVLMASPCNTPAPLNTQEQLVCSTPLKRPLEELQFLPPPPPVSMPMEQAMQCPSHSLPLSDDLVGQVAALPLSVCPPGIPLALPGERLTPQVLEALKNGGAIAVNVVK